MSNKSANEIFDDIQKELEAGRKVDNDSPMAMVLYDALLRNRRRFAGKSRWSKGNDADNSIVYAISQFALQPLTPEHFSSFSKVEGFIWTAIKNKDISDSRPKKERMRRESHHVDYAGEVIAAGEQREPLTDSAEACIADIAEQMESGISAGDLQSFINRRIRRLNDEICDEYELAEISDAFFSDENIGAEHLYAWYVHSHGCSTKTIRQIIRHRDDSTTANPYGEPIPLRTLQDWLKEIDDDILIEFGEGRWGRARAAVAIERLNRRATVANAVMDLMRQRASQQMRIKSDFNYDALASYYSPVCRPIGLEAKRRRFALMGMVDLELPICE